MKYVFFALSMLVGCGAAPVDAVPDDPGSVSDVSGGTPIAPTSSDKGPPPGWCGKDTLSFTMGDGTVMTVEVPIACDPHRVDRGGYPTDKTVGGEPVVESLVNVR